MRNFSFGRMCWLAAFSIVGGITTAIGAQPAHSSSVIDLFSDVSAWKASAPFNLEGMKLEAVHEPNQALRLKILSHGSQRDVGGWVRSLPPFEAGKRYRMEVMFVAEGIESPQRHIWALVTSGSRELQEFQTVEDKGDRYRLALEFTPVKDFKDCDLRLYLAKTVRGAVTWEKATWEDITVRYKPRRAHVAAISGRPKNPASSKEAVEFYAGKLDQVAGLGIDLVCLPENINTDEVVGDRWEMIEPIPGPTTERLAEKARQHNVYIAASIAERDGNARYNTAVLIDRQGAIVAKYRKTHLTVSEQLLSGITAGSEFVVHEADFGKVGLMVCFDHHFPEVPRILALKGAEVLVMPNAADGREKGALWESAMRMRAVDNHVYIVSAVNFGRSLVAAPDGNILAENERSSIEPGGLVHAVCEIGDSVANHTGQPINKRYLQLRRPEIYQALLHDLDGDLKGRVGDAPSRTP